MNTDAADTIATIGTTRFGADFDGHNDSARGIAQADGVYVAFGKTFSRDFKTLNGAVAFMARMGYDAQGRRL